MPITDERIDALWIDVYKKDIFRWILDCFEVNRLKCTRDCPYIKACDAVWDKVKKGSKNRPFKEWGPL